MLKSLATTHAAEEDGPAGAAPCPDDDDETFVMQDGLGWAASRLDYCSWATTFSWDSCTGENYVRRLAADYAVRPSLGQLVVGRLP